MKKIPSGTPVTWQYLYDEHAFTCEHYAMLNQLNRDTLLEIIPELACHHPAASVLLRNKWLTTPDNILTLISREYEERTRETLNFWREEDAERWLHELSCAVLIPVDNVIQTHLDQAEQFILRLIDDQARLSDIFCVGDGWSWHYELHAALFRVILRNARDKPEYLRQRITEMLSDPGIDVSLMDIEWWVKLPLASELRTVLLEFVSVP